MRCRAFIPWLKPWAFPHGIRNQHQRSPRPPHLLGAHQRRGEGGERGEGRIRLHRQADTAGRLLLRDEGSKQEGHRAPRRPSRVGGKQPPRNRRLRLLRLTCHPDSRFSPICLSPRIPSYRFPSRRLYTRNGAGADGYRGAVAGREADRQEGRMKPAIHGKT